MTKDEEGTKLVCVEEEMSALGSTDLQHKDGVITITSMGAILYELFNGWVQWCDHIKPGVKQYSEGCYSVNINSAGLSEGLVREGIKQLNEFIEENDDIDDEGDYYLDTNADISEVR